MLKPPPKESKIILGIDPGSSFTGFGAVRSDGDRVELLSYGVIAPPRGEDFYTRIAIVAAEMEALLERIKPDITVVEQIFMGKNTDSAFKLGHVRGAIIAAAVRAESEIVEYATRVVKKGITGNGNASKEQVQLVLFAAMNLRVKAQADASDALALAYYHARNFEVRLMNQLRGIDL